MTEAAPPPKTGMPELWVGAGAGAAACVMVGALDGGVWQALSVAGVLLALVALWTLLAPRRAPVTPIAADPPLNGPRAPDRTAVAVVLDAAPDPCVLIDGQGRIAAANPLARERLALGKATGRFAALVRRPELVEAVADALEQRRLGDVSYTTMVPIERHERALVSPLELEGERHALLVLHDATDVKRAERTRADFIANASHELRTPLASLIGFIETLRGPARDDPAARERFLEIMAVQAERMRRLINDLLSLSRVELNEHVPPTGRADLAAVAREVADAMAPVARARTLGLEVAVPDAPVWVVGDWDELMQVAQNLIDNALKHSPDGAKVTIGVAAGVDRDSVTRDATRLTGDAARMSLITPAGPYDRAFASLRVRDHGPGIDRRHLPRLAERFYRIDEGRGPDRGGTGLGLAIVKHIVNRHAGGFSVESAVGEGASFTVYLPQPADVTAPAALREAV